MQEKDVFTEMALFSLEQNKGADLARRLSSLEDAVRSLGRNGFGGKDDYGFYL